MAQEEGQYRGLPARRDEARLSRPWHEESWFNSPFSLMRRMHEEMDRWFGGMGGFGAGQPQRWGPSVDLSETGNELVLTADVPGVEPEDLEIYCTDNALILRGETRRDEEREDRGYHRSERHYGRFERVLPLPAEVDRDRIQANFRNGVLEVRLPKTEAARQQMRRIPIQGSKSLTGVKGGESAGEGGRKSAESSGASQNKESSGRKS
jgi:HSP20 family protein